MRFAVRALVVLCAAAATSACSSISVQMKALNPEYVEAESDRLRLRAELPKVLAERGGRRILADIAAAHTEAVEALAAAYRERAEPMPASPGRATLLLAADRLVDPDTGHVAALAADYDTARRRIEAAESSLAALVNEQGGPAAEDWSAEKRKACIGLLTERSSAISDLLSQVSAGLEATWSAFEPHGAGRTAALRAAYREDVDQALSSDPQRLSIAGSPFLYAVASAPDAAWMSVNQAGSSSWFGNSDTAIRLIRSNDPSQLPSGDYTLKGVAFNPSDVARTASKAMTQALIVAAQVSGVPVPSPTAASTEPGAALATSSGRVKEARVASAAAEAEKREFEGAIRRLGSVIASHASQLQSPKPEERRAALIAISAALEAQRARLTGPEVKP